MLTLSLLQHSLNFSFMDFIHPFVHSFIHSFVHSSIHSFIHSFVHSLTHVLFDKPRMVKLPLFNQFLSSFSPNTLLCSLPSLPTPLLCSLPSLPTPLLCTPPLTSRPFTSGMYFKVGNNNKIRKSCCPRQNDHSKAKIDHGTSHRSSLLTKVTKFTILLSTMEISSRNLFSSSC